MKTAVKIFLVIVFFAILGTAEYLQAIRYSVMQQQLLTLLQMQQSTLQELRAVKAQLVSIRSISQRGTQLPEPPIDFNRVYQIDLGNSPVKGNKDASVTVVEFSDFQCPYSQMFHPIVQQAINAFPGKVKFVYKNFPLPYHPLARPAAKAAFAAKEQGKYWEMVEAIFAEGKSLSQEKFPELAKKIGLDVKKFNQDLKEKDAQWEKLIEEDIAAARKAEVKGTPMFYINGKIAQARTLKDFKAAIEQNLKAAPKKK